MHRIWLWYRRAWRSYICLGAWKSLETELRIKSFYPRDWPKLAQDWLPAKYLIDRQWRHSSNKSSPTSIHFKMFQYIWICLIMPKQYFPNKLTLYPETISKVLIDMVNMAKEYFSWLCSPTRAPQDVIQCQGKYKVHGHWPLAIALVKHIEEKN